MNKKLAVVLALLLTMVLSFAGCSTSSASTDPLEDGVLQVAVDDTYPPMEYSNSDAELEGFDIDLAEAIGEKLGVEVEFTKTAWDGIFTGLTSNQYDVIISSTSITPERQEAYSQSDPYISNGIVIVGRTDYGNDIATTFEELAGKKVGVQLETSADYAVQALLEQTGIDLEVKQFDGMNEAFNALKGKTVDYVITDDPVARYYIQTDKDTFVVTSTEPFTNEPIGVTARKDSAELIEKINTALKELKEDGTLKSISEKWFGTDLTDNIDTELNVIE